MQKTDFLRTVAVSSLVIVGLVGSSRPAAAQMAVVAEDGPIKIAFDKALNYLETQATNLVQTAVQDMSKLLDGDLRLSTQQITSNIRGATAASMQIADASNTAMARFQRDVRNAQIAANHAVPQEACLAIDGGQAISLARVQSGEVQRAIARVTDPRGEGGPGTPAYGGNAQAAQANFQQHLSRYCSQLDVEAGLCGAVSQHENADQRASSLIGPNTYPDTPSLDAANDYATTLTQPVPPASLRGDARKSVTGLQDEQARRLYNARMSLARTALSDIIADHAATVSLTPEQQQFLQSRGRGSQTVGSWTDVTDIEVNRRYGNTVWAAGLEKMASAPVLLREIARELALQNQIDWANHQKLERQTALLASLVAAEAKRQYDDRHRVPTMPVPQMASQ